MPNVRISDLPDATLPLTGAELYELTQDGVSRKATVTDLVNSLPGLDASFVTVSANPGLANERVLTGGTAISIVDGGAGNTVTVNALPGAGNPFPSPLGITALGDGDPSNPDPITSQLEIRSDEGFDYGRLGYSSSVDLTLENEAVGGSITLRAQPVGGGGFRTLFTADPDNLAALYHQGSAVARTLVSSSGGFEVNNTSTGAGFERVLTTSDLTGISTDRLLSGGIIAMIAVGGGVVELRSVTSTDIENRYLEFAHQDGTSRAIVGDLGDGQFRIRNQIHGESVSIEGEDAGGVLRTILSGDPDGDVTLYYSGTAVLVVEDPGRVDLRGDLNTDADTRLLEFSYANATRRGFVGHPASSVLTLRNEIHGGSVDIEGEDTGGVLRDIIVGVPDNRVTLYYQGVQALRTESTGASVLDTAGSSAVLAFRDDAQALQAQIISAAASLTVSSVVHGAPITIQGEDIAGVARILFSGDPDGASMLYDSGLAKVETISAGIDVNGAVVGSTPPVAADNPNSRLRLYSSDGLNSLGDIGFLATGNLGIRSLVHGATFSITGEDASGITRSLISADPAGEASISHAGSGIVRTSSDGPDFAPTSGDLLVGFYDSGFASRRAQLLVGSSVLRLRGEVHGANVEITAEDAGGVNRNLIVSDPDARTQIYDPGANEVVLQTQNRTTTDTASAAQVRGVDNVLRDIGFNVWPTVSISGGNYTISRNDIGKKIVYNEGANRSLLLNNIATIPVGAVWVYEVGPSAATLTGDGGTGVQIQYWNGTSWTTTAAAGNITIGEGQGTIEKRTDTLYVINGPNLS